MKPLAYASIIALVAIGIRSLPSVTLTVPFGQAPPHASPGPEPAYPLTAPVQVPDGSRAPLVGPSGGHRALDLQLAEIEVPEDPMAHSVSAARDGLGAPPGAAWAALMPNR